MVNRCIWPALEGSALARQSFLTFFGPRPKVFEKHWFRANRGTTDMIFFVRQIQEKSREQHKDLYMVFIDLTKAFDSAHKPNRLVVAPREICQSI